MPKWAFFAVQRDIQPAVAPRRLCFDLPKPKNRNGGIQNDQDQFTEILPRFLYHRLHN